MCEFEGTFGRYLPTVGCHLAPGRYNIESDKDKIYNVVISKKGPYDVFSEDRTEGQKTGHYATRVSLKKLFNLSLYYLSMGDRFSEKRLNISDKFNNLLNLNLIFRKKFST